MNFIQKYAHLLVDYCLDLKKGEKLYISTTTLAVPLVKEIYRLATQRGVLTEMDLAFAGQSKIFLDHADNDLLNTVPTLSNKAISSYDAYLVIKAPFNLREGQNIDTEKKKIRQEALSGLNQTYFSRTADGSLKRNLCLFPTQASAQEAGMSLEEYETFVYNACRLYDEDPKSSWLDVRARQQKLVDYLNPASSVTYRNLKTDITFSIEGRTWINSDGRTNMPSGEVFTGPVEESVNGIIYFDYPSIFMGKEVRGITLKVENGEVIKWDAEIGKEVLNKVFEYEGSRYFGEAAIGTNYNIQQATKNILFDEKIGGTIHMAIGQSYKQTGGKNTSSIHWDMIADMTLEGEIIVDGEMIYRNGKFITGLLD